MTRRAFSFATIGLVTFALIGIASYYRWRATDPLSVQLVSVGGEVRELQDSLGVTHRGVVHRIETHCYSPGVGLVVDVSANVSPDSILALATALRVALQHEARAGEDRYLTVTLDAGRAQWWPYSSRLTYTFAWTWSERQARWIHFAYSVPSGRVPRAFQFRTPRAPAPVT